MRRLSFELVVLVCLSGCPYLVPAPFVLDVTPGSITDSIPGQRCVFLVTVEEDPEQGGLDGAVHITASSPGATVLVEHEDIVPGEVAEVTVIPQALDDGTKQFNGDEGRDVRATITAEYGDAKRTARTPVHVTSEEEDLVGPLAVEVLDLFIPWLAENHPELGITEETEWTGTIVTPHILVVTHYLYFSEEWEMHVFWHVMIPPYDWGKIELRRRFEETVPSLAFEIPSRSAEPPLEAQAIEPSDTLWR